MEALARASTSYPPKLSASVMLRLSEVSGLASAEATEEVSGMASEDSFCGVGVAEDEKGERHARRAGLPRLLCRSEGEGGGAPFFIEERKAKGTVAVGVCLQNGADGGCGGEGAQGKKITPQGKEVDFPPRAMRRLASRHSKGSFRFFLDTACFFLFLLELSLSFF